MEKKTVRNSAFHQYDSNEPRFAPHLDPDSSPKKGGAGAGATAPAPSWVKLINLVVFLGFKLVSSINNNMKKRPA